MGGIDLKEAVYSRLISFVSVALALAMLVPGLTLFVGSLSANDQAGIEDQQVLAGAVPGEPRNLVADQGPGYVWLWWDHPATNGDELIKKYYIFRGTTAGGEGATPLDWVYVGSTNYEGTDLGGTNFYNDTAVDLETTYYYRLTASSDLGNSSYSNEVSAKPSLTGSTPGAPVVAGLNQVYQAQIDWREPSETGSTPVRFYFVYRQPGWFMDTLLEDWYRGTGYEDEVGFFTELGVEYNYTVRAVNSYGQGDAGMVVVTIGGIGTVPGAPENVSGFGGNGSAFLYWSPPSNPSAGGFDTYDVYRSDNEGGPYVKIGNMSTSSIFGYYGFYSEQGLTNDATYYYKVKSVIDMGAESDFSNIAIVTPKAISISFKVDNLDAYPGNGKVLLKWDAAYNETEGADSYKIYRSESPGAEVLLTTVGVVDQYFDNSVTNGNTYYYKVEPLIGTMAGTMSPEASATPGTGSAPAAPTGLMATPGPYGVEIYLPSATPSSILIGYEVFRGDSSGAQEATPIDEINDTDFDGEIYWTDMTAEPDVNYFYTVKLLNMYGLSASSNEGTSFASPTGDFPDQITDLSATGGPGKITLQWNSPVYQGTANILSYDIERNDTEGTWETIGYIWYMEVGAAEYVDQYIIPGVTYSYRVLASNVYGDALIPSNTDSAAATGSSSAPSAPRNLAAQSGNEYIVLTWDVPTDVGNPALTTYDIYRATTSGGYGSALATVPAGTLTYNDTSAVPGTPYFYVVRAVNTAGPSPASGEATATATSSETTLGAPQNLVATAGKGKVSLSWDAPAEDGGSAILNYQIYRMPEGGLVELIETVGAGTLTYVDEDVSFGTNYTYTVKAVNAHGSSPASASAVSSPLEGESGGSDNTLLLIIGGAIAVAAIAGIAFYFLRKK